MPRIAFISSVLNFPWGGPDKRWTRLAESCQKDGDDIFLAVSSLTAESSHVSALVSNGARLYEREQLSSFRGIKNHLSRQLPWNRNVLENQLSAFQPDTIFITFGGSYDGLLEHYLLSWLEKHPIKYIISCSLSPEPEVFKGRETERFKRFMRNADSVLFLSQENQAIVEAQMEIKLPNARIIQNPLWFHLDEPLAPTCIPPIPRLDYIGRISVYHKGLDFLLNAAGSIIDRTPFTIHLTGKVETAEELDALIQSNGLEDHVHIHDPLPPDQVQEAYAKAEIILLTSRTEGCASTMLEAMMCGRTILATPVGGAPDWLTDEENAFLCQSADTASVTSTLIKALDQRSKWPEMGRQARIAFDQKRDPDPADTLLKILKNETSGYNLP